MNDCDPAKAEDHTGDAMPVPIQFGAAAGNAYSPACVSIKAGQSVEWTGDFGAHPLEGGAATDSALTPDSSSPIASTHSGNSATFKFPNAGTFPFYCGVHGELGMRGAVFVK